MVIKKHNILFLWLIISVYACNTNSSERNKISSNVNSTNEIDESNSKSNSDKVIVTKKEAVKILDEHIDQAHFCKNTNSFFYINETGNEVVVYDLDTKEKRIVIKADGLRNNVSWTKDCSALVYSYKENYQTNFKKVSLKDKGASENLVYPPLTSIASLAYSDTIFYLDKKSLQIQAQYQGKSWAVTADNNRYYNVLISPNGKYLAANEGSNMILINLEDNTKTIIGKGIHTAWHRSNTYLLAYLDESADGHQINNSDIYLYSIENKELVQVTESANLYEANPSFINENTISFTDLNHTGLYSLNISSFLK